MAWTISTLENLIRDEVEEHLQLEYKAAGALGTSDSRRREISKDVSALANSAGGTIIYGIAEGDGSRKHLPERIDWVADPNISKEWLENVISSRIQPRISGLDIVVLRSETGAVFVVDVPQSMTVHQACDKRYYKRQNFSSVPMEDYEIRDVMNRAGHPLIEVVPIIKKRSRPPHNEILFYFFNNGRVKARQVLVEVTFPSGVCHDTDRPVTYNLRNTIRDIVGHVDSHYGSIPKYGTPRYVPIFPDNHFECSNDYFLANDLGSISDKTLTFRIFADDAQPRETSLRIEEIEDFDHDSE